MTEFVVGDRASSTTTGCSARAVDAFHVATLHVRTGREATFASHTLALGGAHRRATTSAPCSTARAARHAERPVSRRRHAARRQPHDIDHAQPHCASHELYKGILGGRRAASSTARSSSGQDAQKTDAKQTNKALLLSDDAHDRHQAAARDLRRRREVHARRDGRPARRRALFYLRARGIGADDARAMLIRGVRQRRRRPRQGRAAARAAGARCSTQTGLGADARRAVCEQDAAH